MEESQIKRDRGKLRKSMREIIEKDLDINEMGPNMIYYRTL